MTTPRRRMRDTSDDELAAPTRVVIPRRSILAEDSNPPEHDNHTESIEPPEESEEPFEEEENPHPTLSRSPPAIPPSVPSSPTIPPSPVFPSLRFSTCRQGNPLRWDWMPTILKWWRRAEQIPVLPDVPGSTTPMLTQEPVHHTIPVLIARMRTHDHQLEQLEQAANDRVNVPTSEVELLQHQVSGIESNLAELSDTVVTTHTIGVQARDEVAELRQQVEANQHRIWELEQSQHRITELEQDRDRMRAVAAQSARMVELLEGMVERLDSRELEF